MCVEIGVAGPKHVVENIPDYPNFAHDVYGVILDYFRCLVEPLLTFDLYDDIVNSVGMQLSLITRNDSEV